MRDDLDQRSPEELAYLRAVLAANGYTVDPATGLAAAPQG